MKQKKTKQYTDTLLSDNAFKFVSENEDTGEQVLNLNIDMGRLSCVRSFAENIHNTMKRMPEIKSIQHSDHMYADINGNVGTVQEDIENLLFHLRHIEDETLTFCIDCRDRRK